MTRRRAGTDFSSHITALLLSFGLFMVAVKDHSVSDCADQPPGWDFASPVTSSVSHSRNNPRAAPLCSPTACTFGLARTQGPPPKFRLFLAKRCPVFRHIARIQVCSEPTGVHSSVGLGIASVNPEIALGPR